MRGEQGLVDFRRQRLPPVALVAMSRSLCPIAPRPAFLPSRVQTRLAPVMTPAPSGAPLCPELESENQGFLALSRAIPSVQSTSAPSSARAVRK